MNNKNNISRTITEAKPFKQLKCKLKERNVCLNKKLQAFQNHQKNNFLFYVTFCWN